MQPVYLFDLASRRVDWLSMRQATLAENVANVNTPGFKARDIEPFATTLDKTQLAMAATAPGHIGFGMAEPRAAAVRGAEAGDPNHSGNNVVLESELIKTGEVSRDYSLTTGVVKAFHRMWMASLKG